MVDITGLPIVFFTLSTAYVQWSKLSHPFSPEGADSYTKHNSILIGKPAFAVSSTIPSS